VHLAKMLKSGANLLLLDEPTNDLDVDTLRALESALEEFAGCAMIISHDRWFLDRIATHMLAFEGDSHVEWFEGNYQDYEADRKRRLGMGPTSRIASSTSGSRAPERIFHVLSSSRSYAGATHRSWAGYAHIAQTNPAPVIAWACPDCAPGRSDGRSARAHCRCSGPGRR
jgi:energy-coupling factor transporter ATP-binding protein EcfA2